MQSLLCDLVQAPSSKLEAYLAGQLPARSSGGRLAEQLDENLRLIQILARELQHFAAQLQALAEVRRVRTYVRGGLHQRQCRFAADLWMSRCQGVGEAFMLAGY